MPPALLVLLAHALVPSPGAPPALGRRSTFAGFAVPLGLFALPGPAVAGGAAAKKAALEAARAREAAESDTAGSMYGQDPLTFRLKQSRDELAQCASFLESKQWDKVRQAVSSLLPLMTFRGYTGESVKTRAEAWVSAGNLELAKEIFDRRGVLVKQLNALDQGVFAAQTSNKKLMLSEIGLQETLSSVLVALDAVIDKMDCDRRWKSGKCEILPSAANQDLGDLVYF